MNLSKNYIALTEGRMSRSEFLRQARQSFPNLIGAGNNFEDALKARKAAEEKYYGDFKYDKEQDYRFRDDKNEVSYG